MKKRLFLILFMMPMFGCEITAQFYIEKAWDESPHIDPMHPDMKTRAQVEFKIPLGDKTKKPAVITK